VRDRRAEALDEVGDEHGRRRSGLVDEVEVAEGGVAGVVVDDDAAPGRGHAVGERAEPVGAAGVERDEHLRRCRDLLRRHEQLEPGQEGVGRRDLERLTAPGGDDLDAEAAQRQTQREHRPERVTVRADVTGQDDRPGTAQQPDDLVDVRRSGAHSSSSSSSPPSSAVPTGRGAR
jgi:hypothetical protein